MASETDARGVTPSDGGVIVGSTRILMLGWVNSPHVEPLALAMKERGYAVHVAGTVAQGLPPSVLPDAGIPTTVLPDERPMPIPGARGLDRIARIRRLVSGLDPHVVHAHYLPDLPFLAVAAGVRPLIASAWGSDVFRVSRQEALRNRVVARRADLVIADSDALLNAVRRLGAAPDKTVLLNWGVDLDEFSPPTEDRAAIRARLGLPAGRTVLSPRILDPVYNIDVVVDAFTTITRKFPDARLVLKHPRVSDLDAGKLRADRERVQVIGHVPHELMADYYRAADVCVSIPSSDSSPRSVWEAMACGCPCIVSALPWVSECIEPGRHAMVVPVEAQAVAGAIERVLSEPDLAARLAARGRELVESIRNRAAEMDKLAEVYASVAHQARRTR